VNFNCHSFTPYIHFQHWLGFPKFTQSPLGLLIPEQIDIVFPEKSVIPSDQQDPVECKVRLREILLNS